MQFMNKTSPIAPEFLICITESERDRLHEAHGQGVRTDLQTKTNKNSQVKFSKFCFWTKFVKDMVLESKSKVIKVSKYLQDCSYLDLFLSCLIPFKFRMLYLLMVSEKLIQNMHIALN